MSTNGSDHVPPQVFDDPTPVNDQPNPTQPTTRQPSGDDIQNPYDLKPPPPTAPLSNVELLADRLFSPDHVRLILADATLSSRFTNFVSRYKPESAPLLRQCIDIHKAVTAIDYANAVADQLGHSDAAAFLEQQFEARANDAAQALVHDALPGYITHRFVQLVTDTLVKEITGQNTPLMRELVHGLAEVYCLTDPSLPDNPIVYASEEFYKTTQYGRDYVIGRNCRFLQGPRTSGDSVQRLIDALADGQEICEVILNYRRDGSPFVNLLMIAPLYDNKGTVRYFIGAQVDINGLVEGGRGLDSFERLLAQDRSAERHGDVPVKSPNALLAELSAMWSNDEVEIARQRGNNDDSNTSDMRTPNSTRRAAGRRYLGMDDPDDSKLWPAPHLGPSGRLPGVFQNYLLVRPYPSLRITFTSPALRIPGLLQSKFLDRIGGPAHIRDGILSAMQSGIGVTAKIAWHATGQPSTTAHALAANPLSADPSRPASRDHHPVPPPPSSDANARTRWIHCTPLLGSDDRPGVWMVVMVEPESITGTLAAQKLDSPRAAAPVTSPRYTGDRLYAEYLRREGRPDSVTGTDAAPGAQRISRAASRAHAHDAKAAKARAIADRAAPPEEAFPDF